MSIFSKENGKFLITRSIFLKSLIFTAIMAVSAIVMQPIQTALSNTIQNIRSNLLDKVEELTNLEIQYSSIRPSLFSALDIKDIKILNYGEPLLTISHVRMHYSIFELIMRKKTFIHKVRIDKPVLNVITERDKDTLEHLLSLVRTEDTFDQIMKNLLEFLPQKADYLVRHCSINIDDKNIYSFKNMNLNVWGNEDNIFLAGRFTSELILYHFMEKGIIINADIGINAVSVDDLKDGNLDIILYSLACSAINQEQLFNLNTVILSLFYKDSIISMASKNWEQIFEEGSQESKYNFQYNIETGGVSADLNLVNFKPSDMINVSEYWTDADNLLQIQITGNASFKKENEKMDYKANLTGSNSERPSGDSIMIDINGNDKFLAVNDLRLNLSPQSANAGFFQGGITVAGDVQFSPLRPSGSITLDKFSLTNDHYGRDSISAVFNVSNQNNEISIKSENIEFTGSKLNNFDIIIFPSQNETALSFSVLFNDNGTVYLDAVYSGEPGELEASIVFDAVSLYDISEVIRPFINYPKFAYFNNKLTDSTISSEIFLYTDFKKIAFNAPNTVFNINGVPGMLSVTATDDQVTITEGIFYIEENEFLVSANLLYSNPMEILFSVNASFIDLSWYIEGQLYDKTTLIISDPNGLNLYGNLSNSKAVSGYMEGSDFPIYINSQTVYLNFFINLRYNSRNQWDLGVDHITAREKNSPDGKEYLRLKGFADQSGGSFVDIVVDDSVGMLEGNADFLWEPDFSFISFFVNFSDGRESGEAYNIEGFRQNEHINIVASVKDMHLNRFTHEISPMLISAEANVSWDSIDAFNANINVIKINSVTPNDYIRGSVEINVDNEEILITNLALDIAGLKTVLPVLQVKRNLGHATAAAHLIGRAFERNIEGDIKLDINFLQLDSWLDFKDGLNHFNGKMQIDNIKYNSQRQDPFVFVFSRENGAISVSGGIKDMLRLDMDSEGNFYAGLSAPLPIRGTLIGTYTHGIIDASCSNFFFDLAELWSLMSRTPEFNIASGYITGAIDIRGSIWNPEFYGSARGSSFRFQAPNYIKEDIKPVPFQVLAQGYEMSFGPVVMAVGSGSGTINGWFLFENWSPVNIGLDINVPRDNPVPYNINVAGFLANGTTSGNFRLNLDSINSLMECIGDLFTNNAELGLNMEEIGANDKDHSEDQMYILMNLKITLGSSVEFLWPGTSPILRANPEMGTVLNISTDSRAGQFSLISDVRIRSGELYYFDRSFYIRQGSIIFRENETQFNPRFSTRAEIRDRADSGPVTISMVVDNQPLLSFEPRFESTPTLSQLELYSILGQNVNSMQSGENADTAQRFLITSTTDILTQVVATSDVFSQFVFMRQFERVIRDFLRLDMFSVRTRFLQNAVVTGFTGFNQEPDELDINRSSQVGNYFDNTTVFIGKYIGQFMFIQGMLTMRYDENSSVLGGIRFEPDIGIELQSPFVNIRWDFVPSYLGNWWMNGAGIVADNSITLSWSRSF